jgi:hypothetical protein
LPILTFEPIFFANETPLFVPVFQPIRRSGGESRLGVRDFGA